MCLDGALLRREGVEPTLLGLRSGFASSRGAPSERAAELHHFERHTRSDEDRALFRERLERIATEIARGPWIDGYQNGDGIALRLAGVRARLGLPPMSIADRERVATALTELESFADTSVNRLLDERPVLRSLTNR
jgi:hypothetical protein